MCIRSGATCVATSKLREHSNMNVQKACLPYLVLLFIWLMSPISHCVCVCVCFMYVADSDWILLQLRLAWWQLGKCRHVAVADPWPAYCCSYVRP